MIDPTLSSLLDGVHRNQLDHVAKLVAADRAQECGEEKCELLLRYLIALERKPRDPGPLLSTGSRSYGKPTEDSDWDWVLYTSEFAVEKWLKDNRDWAITTKQFTDYEQEIGEQGLSAAYRFGPVNIILVNNTRQWKAWKEGTEHLMRLYEGRGLRTSGPRTREQAIAVFTYYRNKYLVGRNGAELTKDEEAELGVSG